jgi:hypothetical protein
VKELFDGNCVAPTEGVSLLVFPKHRFIGKTQFFGFCFKNAFSKEDHKTLANCMIFQALVNTNAVIIVFWVFV